MAENETEASRFEPIPLTLADVKPYEGKRVAGIELMIEGRVVERGLTGRVTSLDEEKLELTVTLDDGRTARVGPIWAIDEGWSPLVGELDFEAEGTVVEFHGDV